MASQYDISTYLWYFAQIFIVTSLAKEVMFLVALVS